jgi:integrase
MAYGEKRGRFWRARWVGPDGTLESKSGFTTEKAAVQYGRDQEAAIRSDTYEDPRAGEITITDWINDWYPAQDLEPTTLTNYRYAIESFILPEFGGRALREITPEEVGKWEKSIVARGWAPRTARDARTTLTVLYGDAIPRHVKVNPAQRKRGKGRKGRRRIERIEQQTEKVWPTPIEALLVAERVAALTGRDEDFIMEITDAYTGMRWSETTGLTPKSLRDDELDVHWKLYELGGRFYKGRPKDGSMRTVDLPPFLAQLLAWHVSETKGRKCTCRKPQDSDGPDEHNKWCTGDIYMFLSGHSSHYQRSHHGERQFRPAADGWYPERKHRPARPVLIDASGQYPGTPLAAWPAAISGEEFAPPTGRGVVRFMSDESTGRCQVCRRAFPRRQDGMVVAHKADGARCNGSGLEPGEDLALASCRTASATGSKSGWTRTRSPTCSSPNASATTNPACAACTATLARQCARN